MHNFTVFIKITSPIHLFFSPFDVTFTILIYHMKNLFAIYVNDVI